MLSYLKLGEFVSTQVTMGLNSEVVKKDGLYLHVYDLGGNLAFRSVLWNKLLDTGCDLIIYIVDATDSERIVANEEEIGKVLHHHMVRGVPIVLVANKQDLPEAKSAEEIALQMNLMNYNSERKMYLISTSMKTGAGIDKLIDALEAITAKK